MKGRQLLAHTQAALLADHPDLVVLGEGTAAGGLHGTLAGLEGPRVRELTGSGAARAAVALGLALQGRPVLLHLPDPDLALDALEVLALEAARARHRSSGRVSANLVVRVSCSAVGEPGHAGRLEGRLAAVPGLKVAAAGDPAAASGLLRAAIADPDPVVILEAQSLYGALVPAGTDPDAAWPLGRAALLAEGDDLTLVTWGEGIEAALDAADRCAASGVSCEVLDLRSLSPLDRGALRASVARTGRVVIAHHGPRHGGLGAEVAATLAEWSLVHLAAPPVRVTGVDAPLQRDTEGAGPDTWSIVAACRQVAHF